MYPKSQDSQQLAGTPLNREDVDGAREELKKSCRRVESPCGVGLQGSDLEQEDR